MGVFDVVGEKIGDLYEMVAKEIGTVSRARSVAKELSGIVGGTVEEIKGYKGTYWDIEGEHEGRKLTARVTSVTIKYTVKTMEERDYDVRFHFDYLGKKRPRIKDGAEPPDPLKYLKFEWERDTEISGREVVKSLPRQTLELLASLATTVNFFALYTGFQFELQVPFNTLPLKDRGATLREHLALVARVISAVEAAGQKA